MAEFTAGDLVVLKSGSMRMIVASVEGDDVSVIWANEGLIGRDVLPAFCLNKWEHREERPFTPRPPQGDRPFTPRPPREDRPFTPRPPRAEGEEERPYKPRPRRDEEGGDRPARPWAAKPGGGKPYGAKPGGFGPKPGGFGGGKPGMDGKPRPKNFYRKED